MTSLDTLRERYPHLGFAVYAYKPGGTVTLECLTPSGESFKFPGRTLADAIALGFPEDVEPTLEPSQPDPINDPKTADTSVFD